MGTLLHVEEHAAPEVRGALADLICADPDLLRVEFDAIIEAGWGDDAPPRQPDDDAAAPGPASTPRARTREAASAGHPGRDPTLADDLTRPRSPPRHPPR